MYSTAEQQLAALMESNAALKGILQDFLSRFASFEQNIRQDMEATRNGCRAEVKEYADELAEVRLEVAQMKVAIRIIAVIGGAIIVALVGVAVPNTLHVNNKVNAVVPAPTIAEKVKTSVREN